MDTGNSSSMPVVGATVSDNTSSTVSSVTSSTTGYDVKDEDDDEEFNILGISGKASTCKFPIVKKTCSYELI